MDDTINKILKLKLNQYSKEYKIRYNLKFKKKIYLKQLS